MFGYPFYRLLFAFWLAIAFAQSTMAQSEVRVGVVAYEDFRGELEFLGQFFADVSKRNTELDFRLAAGSYGDVGHWIDRQLIDVAVMPSGTLAGIIESKQIEPAYIATMQLSPSRSMWATPARRADGFHNSYGSVCLVADDSTLRTVDDLRIAARENRLEFLFVHPMSVSGRVVPARALREIGIETAHSRVRFTYSHAQSIRMLQSRSAAIKKSVAIERVAFVWDDAAANDPELQKDVRQLIFPALESMEIPASIVVGRADSQIAAQLAPVIDGVESGQYRFARVDDWREKILEVRQWLEAEGLLDVPNESQPISLDEIGHMLLQHARSQPTPPRLALVLSGGGAKCSYQVGAVTALEETLTRLREETKQPGLDIALVVGTSGGAINAVPVAMGITRDPRGRDSFRGTWSSLDQRAIVQPSILVRANMGLWLAIIQTAIVIAIVRNIVTSRKRRTRASVLAILTLGFIQLLIACLPGSPWRWMGMNHVWHHLWLWLSFGAIPAACFLLAIGIGFLISQALRSKRDMPRTELGKWMAIVLVAGILGLPILQGITIFLYSETFSGGQGMQHELSNRFTHLINDHLSQQKLPPLAASDRLSDAAKLKSVSSELMRRRLLTRDLVLTGSCIDPKKNKLPSDLYFYASADETSVPPSFGERGFSLASQPDVLLDVMMGSGSIFPIFPPRRIEDVPGKGQYIELIDGGFAHNSPIEAAVIWGATHIVLIEASPQKQNLRGTFLKNAASSFAHLYQQAQLLDARSRGKTVIFSLAPEAPHLCVLDFADNLIAESIRRGYKDASIDATTQQPRFSKELGEPVFQ